MYRRKQYGQSKIDRCPFCGKQATAKNSQGVPVCSEHKDSTLGNLKCACGEWLDVRVGKWGPYFNCMNCGNINLRKALEMNPDLEKEEPKEKVKLKHAKKTEENKPTPAKKAEIKPGKTEKKEIVVTSDELDFLY